MEGYVPADRNPFRSNPFVRASQPVRIGLQIRDRGRLGADMPTAQHIVGIAPDGENAVPFELDEDAAIGFADVAGARP